jgi:hypothetical protein
MGDRFTVTLLYLGGERPTHPYTVFRGMPVSFLRYNLACLLRCELPVSLFVGPHWSALAHSGTITDRVFPGTTLSCPYVEQGSEIRVQATTATLLDTLILASVPLFDPRASSMSDVEDPPSLSGDAVPEEWGAISPVPVLWGRADPPPHPDTGREWSDTTDRADRARWDTAKGSVSPPPPVQARDLFSDGGDGLSLRHLRRKGENAGRYFSSGSGDKEESSDKEETQAPPPRDNIRHEGRLAEMRRGVDQRAINVMNTTPVDGGLSPHELVFGRPDGGGSKGASSSIEEGEQAPLATASGEQALLATESGERAANSTKGLDLYASLGRRRFLPLRQPGIFSLFPGRTSSMKISMRPWNLNAKKMNG